MLRRLLANFPRLEGYIAQLLWILDFHNAFPAASAVNKKVGCGRKEWASLRNHKARPPNNDTDAPLLQVLHEEKSISATGTETRLFTCAALQGAPVKAGVWRVASPRTPSHAGLPAHVWLCVAFPCLGKRASWWLSRARGRFGPFGAPRGSYAEAVRRGPAPRSESRATQVSPEILAADLRAPAPRPGQQQLLPAPGGSTQAAPPSKDRPAAAAPAPSPRSPSREREQVSRSCSLERVPLPKEQHGTHAAPVKGGVKTSLGDPSPSSSATLLSGRGRGFPPRVPGRTSSVMLHPSDTSQDMEIPTDADSQSTPGSDQDASDVESEVRSLRYLASQLPQVLESDHVSSLVDEWHLLRCDSANSLQLMEDGRIDTRWATVFQQKCAAGQQKYPLLSRLVKALLSLPHSNADCERGFSENKHLLEGRASLCIASINGLRQVKTYLQRYDGDATKVPLSPDLLRSVKRARARYEERIGSREADMKRKKPDSAQVDADNSHDKRLKKQLE
ncbi:hypothetical protein HPB47_017455 [Ixodes persulcatus]|uniref:Uncharacterized protein n=1 Tax=Ixodes persulcatus TaxID=34615 RepID=A0AC60QQL7_IXOPE|nr:hypothetical protein HPB47_017455 [Ixodes persulcatus]